MVAADEKNIKNIRAEFKRNGIFYTTEELAKTLKSYVDFKPTTIYDPTCGQGNLLSVFDKDIQKFGQELFPDELEKAKARLTNFNGYAGDVLTDDGFKGVKFDLIVANPPFSVRWIPNGDDIRFRDAPCVPTGSRADYAFLLHILHHLNNKGKAVCLQFPGVLYRGQREGKIREWMIRKNWIERVVSIPGNTFIDTAIATCIIVFNKSKDTTGIIFEDKELGEEREVSIEEVVDNGYQLTVCNFIIKEEQRKEVDPTLLANEARRSFILRFQKELEFEKQVCLMEGISIRPFLNELKGIIEQTEREDK